MFISLSDSEYTYSEDSDKLSIRAFAFSDACDERLLSPDLCGRSGTKFTQSGGGGGPKTDYPPQCAHWSGCRQMEMSVDASSSSSMMTSEAEGTWINK